MTTGRLALLTILLAGSTLPRSSAARTHTSLNGEWEVCFSSSASMPAVSAEWQPVRVPQSLERQPARYVWYKRSFALPPHATEDHLFVRFGGVKYVSEVFVNTRKVGGHTGGWEPFEMDITAAVQPGPNLLAVRVEDVRALIQGEVPYLPGRDMVDQAKDAVLAPIGSRTTEVGLWQGVSLSVRNACFVEDVFVQTSVRQQRVDVEVTVRNLSSVPVQAHARCHVLQGTQRVLSLEGDAEVVAAGKTQKLRLGAPWDDAIPWDPDRPHLYGLSTELWIGERQVDSDQTRFGFREFWTDGPDLILNGTPLRFLATAGHPRVNSTREDAVALYRAVREANCMAIRLHANVWPEFWYEVADEMGMLLIQESAIWCFVPQYALSQPAFWDQAKQHLSGMIFRDRNHPSIVMYSVENEILHCGGDQTPGCEEQLAELGRFVKQLDPTRPIMYDGDADPGGVADVINLHYPHEFPDYHLYPNTCNWLDRRTRVSGYPRTDWEWARDKPLYMGEFLWSHAPTPNPYTIFLGDKAYLDYTTGRAQAKAMAWEMQIKAYRMASVSGMCPWTLMETGAFPNPGYSAVKAAYAPTAAFVKEYDTRFFAGERVERTVFLANDTRRPVRQTLNWRLLDTTAKTGQVVDSGSLPFELPPARDLWRTITLDMPTPAPSTGRRPLSLELEVMEGELSRFRSARSWAAFAQTPARAPNGVRVALYDRDDRVADHLRRAGVQVTRIGPPWQTAIPESICVIGAGMLPPSENQPLPVVGQPSTPGAVLAGFVHKGGVLLVLEQDAYPPDLLPASLTDHGCTLAFRRARLPGLFEGLAPDDFKFWRGDHMVARHMLEKPSAGAFRTLVDAGSRGGLAHAALLEVPMGQGSYLLSQLLLAEKLDTEPVAGLCLTDLLVYAHRLAQPRAPGQAAHTGRATLRVLGQRLAGDLDAVNAQYEPLTDLSQLRPFDVALLDGQAIERLPSTADTTLIRRFAEAGGTVVFHALTPVSLSRLGSVFPSAVMLQESHAVPVVIEREVEPLIQGLSNQDLYWLGPHTGTWLDRTPLFPGIIAFVATDPLPPVDQCRTIEAESMRPVSGDPHVRENDVILWKAGELVTDMDFGEGGVFTMGLTASGTPVAGVFPEATVYVDGVRAGSVTVGREEPAVYCMNLRAPAGRHAISVRFTNDAYDPKRHEDRNLFIDRIALAERHGGLQGILNPAALVKIPCGKGQLVIDQILWEGQASRSDQAARYLATWLTNLGVAFREDVHQGIRINASAMDPEPGLQLYEATPGSAKLATNGYLATRVQFAADGPHVFVVSARGTPVEGVFPAIRVSVDGKDVGEQELPGPGRHRLEFRADIAAGVHEIRVAFVNDRWEPPEDRNVEILALLVRVDP